MSRKFQGHLHILLLRVGYGDSKCPDRECWKRRMMDRSTREGDKKGNKNLSFDKRKKGGGGRGDVT